MIFKKTHCILCTAEESRQVVSVRDYEYETVSDIFSYQQCLRCGLVYLNPLPESRDLPLFYPAHYEQYRKQKMNRGKKIMHSLRERTIITLRMKAVISAMPQKEGLKILDIGCGNGSALLAIKRLVKAPQLHGVDLSSSWKEFLESEGIILHQGSFEDLSLPKDYFDLIILNHVIEHFLDPREVMKRVFTLLAAGGLVYLETHIIKCLERHIFGRYWIGFDAPRHITVFDKRVLTNLLNGCGFAEVIINDRISAFSDIINSLKRYCLSKFRNRLFALIISERNLILLFISLVFNFVRLRFFPSSVVAVRARKIKAD